MKKPICLLALCALLLAGCGTGSDSSSYLYAAPPVSGEWTADSSAAETPNDGHSLDADGEAAKSGEIIEIKEKMFVAQTNDVYLNTDDYLGRTIRYEGIMFSEWDEGLGRNAYYVVRYGPGCCGYDSLAGFEVTFEDGYDYPPDNSWVEATGVVDVYERNGWPIIWVKLDSLVVKAERGAETVLQ